MQLAKVPKMLAFTLLTALIMVLSILATVFAANYLRGYTLSFGDLLSLNAFRLDREGPSKHYDLFAGHSFCEQAIRKKVDGRIVSLTSDDRAAKVNSYANTNVLIFKADIVPLNTKFRSEHLSTRQYDIKCATSIASNKVVNLTIQPVEEF